MFYIQAKISPNLWVPVGELSPELAKFQSGYTSKNEASNAKSKVKNYLKYSDPANKVPIRIVLQAEC